MEKSKFSEAQIAFILRQADEGTPIAEICRKAGISPFQRCNATPAGQRMRPSTTGANATVV